MNEYDMAEVQKQWYDRDGWPLDLNAVYAINEFKGDSSDMADVQKWYLDGGPGSGNWGHKGRPGIKGGSGKGGGVQYRYNTLQNNVYTSEAKAWAENKEKNKSAASGGGSGEQSELKKALESGDSEQLVQAVKDAKPGQIVKYTNSINSYDYMKMENGSWIALQSGHECSSDAIEKFAGSQTHKFSTSDIADQDFEACQKKFDTAMEVDHSAKKPGQDTYDKVLNTAHELPTGAKYESPDGEVFVKLADGSWEYDGQNVTEEDIAEHLTDTAYGGAAGFKKHAYGEQAPEPSGSNSVSKKASNNTFDGDDYSQDRKKAALWDETKEEIHEKLVSNSGDEWSHATEEEKNGIWKYTGSDYKKINAALYDNDTPGKLDEYKANGYGDLKSEINGATNYLDKCTTKSDIWAERGTSDKYAPSILGISEKEFRKRLQGDGFDDLVGKEVVQEGFLSTSPKKGASYNGQVKINAYIPAGSHASYAEPFSMFGYGAGKNWDGSPETTSNKSFGEFELIVQRGSTFKITKVVQDADGTLYIDVDVHTANKSDLKSIE